MNPIGSVDPRPIPESSAQVPKFFTTLPQVGDVKLTKVTAKVPLGIVSETHPLMQKESVQVWAEDLMGDSLFIALSSWLEKDEEALERAQASCYKKITADAKTLFDNI